MADKVPQDVAATAPDPEEDDLDDLDDVLDSFQAKPAAAPTPATSAPQSSGPERPPAAQDGTAAAGAPEDFTKQIQESMASLMSELDSNPDMQAEFEKMMAELISADGGAGAAGLAGAGAGPAIPQPATSTPKAPTTSTPSSSTAGKKEEADFQSTIRKTMERINASDSTATASTSAAPSSEEDLLAAMMKELGGGGEGGEGDFNSMLMNMMAHLTNKEILYEPMKELHDKFPAWMEKNAEKEKKEDLDRYKEQQKLVGEIVGRFERKGYKDENEDDREYIVERMQKMQAAGSPPSDLVGDMSAAQEALGDLDQGCPMQ